MNVLTALGGLLRALVPVLLALGAAFVGFMLVGHYLAGRRISRLGFRYDETFDPLQHHKSEVVCVLDVD